MVCAVMVGFIVAGSFPGGHRASKVSTVTNPDMLTTYLDKGKAVAEFSRNNDIVKVNDYRPSVVVAQAAPANYYVVGTNTKLDTTQVFFVSGNDFSIYVSDPSTAWKNQFTDASCVNGTTLICHRTINASDVPATPGETPISWFAKMVWWIVLGVVILSVLSMGGSYYGGLGGGRGY